MQSVSNAIQTAFWNYIIKFELFFCYLLKFVVINKQHTDVNNIVLALSSAYSAILFWIYLAHSSATPIIFPDSSLVPSRAHLILAPSSLSTAKIRSTMPKSLNTCKKNTQNILILGAARTSKFWTLFRSNNGGLGLPIKLVIKSILNLLSFTLQFKKGFIINFTINFDSVR